MKMKIQIKSVSNELLFEFEKSNNTIKDTLLEAIKQGTNLSNAYLRNADLSTVDLSNVDLSNANLSNAYLRNTYLCNANLRNADLSFADLRNADLLNADLRNADLRFADLSIANLRNANLNGANLNGANLNSANLRNADLSNADMDYVPLNCPNDGAFVGWKKVQNKLIKLLIPEDAKRCSSTTYKCRCDKAQVLAITTLDEKTSLDSIVNGSYKPYIEYKVGEMVFPDKFDENRWNECSNGIHFFINKQDAIDY